MQNYVRMYIYYRNLCMVHLTEGTVMFRKSKKYKFDVSTTHTINCEDVCVSHYFSYSNDPLHVVHWWLG